MDAIAISSTRSISVSPGKPLPNGMAWNMVVDRNATPGAIPSATHEQLWSRLKFFLDELIPVAEAAGVTLAEVTDGNIYDTAETYSRQQKLGCVHLRNVRGKVPTYKKTSVDDGNVDTVRVLRILKKNNYQGVLIPDHAPQMSYAAP